MFTTLGSALLIWTFLVVIFYFKTPWSKVAVYWLFGLIFILLISVLLSSSLDPAVWLAFTQQGSGYAAWLLLVFVLSIGPLSRLTKFRFWKKILSSRRDLGVGVFLLAFYHYQMSWIYTFGLDPSLFQNILSTPGNYSYALQFGFQAFLILLLVSLISNRHAQKALKKPLWKSLQLLVYPAFVLISLHILFIGSIVQQSPVVGLMFWSGIIWVLGIKVYDFIRSRFKKSSKASPATTS